MPNQRACQAPSLAVALGVLLGACAQTSSPVAAPASSESPSESTEETVASAEAPPASDPQPEPPVTTDAAEPAATGAAEPATTSAAATSAREPAQQKAAAAPQPLPKPLRQPTAAKCGADPGVGEKLKSFRLPDLRGKTVQQNSFSGRVLVVNFWGTWCKPCLEELPEFDKLYRRYRDHGMTLLAIATDEDKQGVAEFVQRRKLAAKVAYAAEAYATQYGQSRFPFTFVVDPAGVIKASYSGYRPECLGKLEADIRTELERAAAK